MRTPRMLMLAVAATITTAACGTSLYRPISNKDSSAALREQTLLLLNDGQYEDAASTAEKLWADDKTNANASLYAIALASTAGVGLFDLTVKAINSATSTTSSKSGASTATGNNVFNTLSSVLPSFTTEQLSKLKKSIDVLDAAPDKAASGLKFQRCLTAGIYTVPTITNLQQSISNVQSSLSSLPSKLGSGSGTGCSASSSVINSAAAEVTISINGLATIASDFSSAMTIIDECFSSSTAQGTINTVSQQVSKLKTNADKGCSIPTNQKLGSYTLPSCLNETIAATGGNTAVAGDGIIAGCELFLNCPSGTCL